MRGSGVWHAEQAWLGHVATDVLIEVEDGRIFAVAENVQPPADAVKLEGFTFPGLANVHSHVFQESLRGRTETGGGDFWEWRRQMFDAAQGWDRYARLQGLQVIHDAEKAALHGIEKADRGPAWDEVRRNLFGLTESGGALVSWKAEHGEIGHKAEDAAFMAALGLVAGNLISQEQAKTLLRPLSEALPWLLPEENQPVA